jgi:dTDP-4-amino-4,6-dideoxygalactose transaminase
MDEKRVPYFRPAIGQAEVDLVLETLRSGWLTTGPRVKQFERDFAAAVGADHAVAVNSATAALHLAVEALKLTAGAGVLIPTMTFAATGEILRYLGAIPILVDCDPVTLNMDLGDASRKIEALRAGRLPATIPAKTALAGAIPVHVGGLLMDLDAVRSWAQREGLWLVEDAAHAFPAAGRTAAGGWRRCGEGTADVTCFSFYANKTITTGEGGMAVTDDPDLAARMRLMSLHGLSQDAWDRFSGGKSWDYRIVAPGYKYNLTDIAAAIGIPQLARAEPMRKEREAIAQAYGEALADVEELELPAVDPDRIHSWHLYPIRLRLDRLTISRNDFMDRLKDAGVGCSVHWRPLHLHPYYQSTFGWRPEDLPVATRVWERLISLPIFPGMRDDEVKHVANTVRDICAGHLRAAGVATTSSGG